jgi:phosphohistidine phosphatase SixA
MNEGFRMHRLAATLVAFLLLTVSQAAGTEAGWALVRNGGQIVFLVHANAPGSGDPANFDIENCRTQRNLSESGRQQARRIGALFAARAAPVEQVYSSRYCRALDTARLAFGDRSVEILEALDSIGRASDEADERNEEIYSLIRDYSGSGNLVLVTHPENIAAMVGTKPREGQAVIVSPTDNGVEQIGSIVFN